VRSGAARGSGWDFLGRHHAVKGNYDVGLPGSDGAGTGVARQQVPQRVRKPVVDPVPHHDPDARRGS
jgi:hypothetical protein